VNSIIVEAGTVITVTDEIYAVYDWMPVTLRDDGTILITIVDDSSTRRYFDFRDRRIAGFALADNVYAVLIGLPGEHGLAALIAHELGHAAMGLPDLYPADQWDIMSAPAWAYNSNFVGCRSLAALGSPCTRSYLPLI